VRAGNTPNLAGPTSWFDSVIAALRQLGLRLLPIAWRIPRQREDAAEPALESLGAVQIRRAPAACFVGTCVQGELPQARDTALRRLTNYLNGENCSGAVLQGVRPVIQQQIGPLLWRISLQLPGTSDDMVPPSPRAPKVNLWSTQPAWLAVVRMSGRPVYSAVAGGDAMVLNALATTDWVATGAPMLLLHAAGPLRWFSRRFEVAVPVAPRRRDEAPYNADTSVVEHLWAG
jgi:hypothetical protein